MKIASGSFPADGTPRDVTDLGAPADLVLTKTGTTVAQLWLSSMPAASRKPMTGSTAPTTTNSISQHAQGFSVGTDAAVNPASGTVYWTAISDNAVADFQVGSYSGLTGDSRDLALLDFDPNAVIIASAGADACVFRLSSMSGDLSGQFAASALTTNIIQAFITSGWQVGTSATVNTNGGTYYYAALKDAAGLCKVINDGSNRAYQGNAVDGRSIPGAGFQPDALALVKATNGVVACARFKAHTGDQTADLDAASATGADRIQQFLPDGFEVGTSTRTNANLIDFHALVLKEGATGGVAGPSVATTLLIGP